MSNLIEESLISRCDVPQERRRETFAPASLAPNPLPLDAPGPHRCQTSQVLRHLLAELLPQRLFVDWLIRFRQIRPKRGGHHGVVLRSSVLRISNLADHHVGAASRSRWPYTESGYPTMMNHTC